MKRHERKPGKDYWRLLKGINKIKIGQLRLLQQECAMSISKCAEKDNAGFGKIRIMGLSCFWAYLVFGLRTFVGYTDGNQIQNLS